MVENNGKIKTQIPITDKDSQEIIIDIVMEGKSAYDMAVEKGFDGTLEEWLLSLHGKDGKDADVDGIQAQFDTVEERLDSTEQELNEKANKAQEDWITPTLLNGWYAIRPDEPPQYMKDEFGFVHFRGAISKGENATGNAAFQLPNGYRPDVNTTFSLPEIKVNARAISVTIFSHGAVDFAGAPLNSWYGISYITFKAV